MNKEIMTAFGFGRQVAMVEKGLCPMCGKRAERGNLRDEISLREFEISGMCQGCQDSFFKE